MSGKQLDEFTLKKPAGWQPSTAAKQQFIDNFVYTYEPRTTLETQGALVSSARQPSVT